jgi:hypothetical protein
VSADFRTDHLKGYLHPWPGSSPEGHEPYIHVVHAVDQEYPLGDFTLAGIAELVQMAGQAWARCPGVVVRYVIETRRRYDGTGPNPHPWTIMWRAVAGEDDQAGVSEDFARQAFDGMHSSQRVLACFEAGALATGLEWRLVRRTSVTSDEILSPDAGQTCPGGC